jgi:hypothetical protein
MDEMVQSSQLKRPDNITAIAVYHFVVSGMMLMCTMLMFLIAYIPIQLFVVHPIIRQVALLGAGMLFLIPLLLAVLMLAIGFGLLKMRSWARWLAIVMAVFALTLVPIGTIIGIFIIFYLLKEDTGKLFTNSHDI